MAKKDTDTEAVEYTEIMKWSYNQQSSDYARLESLQQSYDNIINPATWPTESEIPTGKMFTAVEESLGPAMEYLLPDSKMLQLIPEDDVTDMDAVRKAEWALWTTAIHKVKLPKVILRSIKDCFKLGLGYGHVDVVSRRPVIAVERIYGSNSTRSLDLGDAKKEIRYRYVNTGRIIPYPSGVDFNGDNATPMTFFIDPYSEDDFMDLFEGTENGMKAGINPKEIVDNIRKIGFTSIFSFNDVLSTLSGNQLTTNGIDMRKYKNAKCTIPVIKVYENNKHTWIACNGQFPVVIYQASDQFQTVRNPCIKWSAWPDGDRWFAMSAPEADQKMAIGHDIWFNFMFDMMTWMKDRNLVYTPDAFDGKMPKLRPGDPIKVSRGRASDGATWLEAPRLDPMIGSVGEIIESSGSRIRGMKDMMQKNFTRGGAGAFQDLLSSVEARQILSYAILEAGGLTPTLEQIMVYMQLLASESGETFRGKAFNRDTGVEETKSEVVGANELVRPYTLFLDLRSKNRMSSMDMQNRIAIFDRVKDDPRARPDEARRLLPLDEVTHQRLWRGKDEMEEIDRQDRELQVRERLAGVAAKQPEAPQTPSQQGPMGATQGGVEGGQLGQPVGM